MVLNLNLRDYIKVDGSFEFIVHSNHANVFCHFFKDLEEFPPQFNDIIHILRIFLKGTNKTVSRVMNTTIQTASRNRVVESRL